MQISVLLPAYNEGENLKNLIPQIKQELEEENINYEIIIVDSMNKTDDTEENTEYDVSMFTSIDVDGVVDAFKSSEMKVIYMGRSTCGYCVQFLPNLQKAQEEYGYETLYLDISTVDSDGQSKIVDLDKDFFEENYGATPTVLLVKDNKIVDSHVGYSEYDDYAKFLEKNGFSKK